MAEYESCSLCGYLRVSNPYWLQEAYSSAIVAQDTGVVMRNVAIALKVSSFLFWLMNDRGQGRYLDVAGGYGLLTRLMRDQGYDFYWADKYCANLFARGFEFGEHLTGCHAVTAIEVMEHISNPLAFVEETLRMAGADTLLFTTELYSGSPPKINWWYYSFPSGQHIGFFTKLSLEMLGKRLGLNFLTANGLHVLSRRTFSKMRMQWITNRRVAQLLSPIVRRYLVSMTLKDYQSIIDLKL